jgi:hypothetical protein
MFHRLKFALWHTRYNAATWLLPVAIMGLFFMYVIIPLETKTKAIQHKIAESEQNIYRSDWLDSVNQSLEHRLKILRQDLKQLRSRTVPFTATQPHTDRVRQILAASDLNVIKIQTVAEKAGSLTALKTEVSGKSNFGELTGFLKSLYQNHPAFFIDNITVRRTKKELNFRMSLLAYSQTSRLRLKR